MTLQYVVRTPNPPTSARTQDIFELAKLSLADETSTPGSGSWRKVGYSLAGRVRLICQRSGTIYGAVGDTPSSLGE